MSGWSWLYGRAVLWTSDEEDAMTRDIRDAIAEDLGFYPTLQLASYQVAEGYHDNHEARVHDFGGGRHKGNRESGGWGTGSGYGEGSLAGVRLEERRVALEEHRAERVKLEQDERRGIRNVQTFSVEELRLIGAGHVCEKHRRLLWK